VTIAVGTRLISDNRPQTRRKKSGNCGSIFTEIDFNQNIPIVFVLLGRSNMTSCAQSRSIISIDALAPSSINFATESGAMLGYLRHCKCNFWTVPPALIGIMLNIFPSSFKANRAPLKLTGNSAFSKLKKLLMIPMIEIIETYLTVPDRYTVQQIL
jgi:hypothetical protein